MRILAIDAALGPALVAVTEGGTTKAEAGADDAKGLAGLVEHLPLDGLAAVAVTVGPGSFTGLRSALAFAHGFAAGRGIALVPITVAEALGAALPHRGGRVLWVAIDSRRERIFLDRGEGMQAIGLAEIIVPSRPVAVAGNAAREVAAILAARAADVMLTDARRPRARDIAQAAVRRLAGELPPLPALPMYVDPPAARLPSA